MERVVIALALILIVTFVALIAMLAILRAGIRRQERAACFTCRPRGLSTAIARRVLGLYARGPGATDRCHHTDRGSGPTSSEPSPVAAKKESS
jgi:hypothetical protein